jgi:hypothetical protein
VKRITLLVATILLVASAAIAQDTRYNFDKNADFSKFKTYKWVALKDAAKPNELMDKQIIAAVDSELTTKGLSKVDGDNVTSTSDTRLELARRRNSHPTTATGVMVADGTAADGTAGVE